MNIKAEEANVVQAVECMACKKLHRKQDNTFYSFWGNVCLGSSGGIVGNNFDEAGELQRVSYVCASVNCLSTIFKEALGPNVRDSVRDLVA